MPSLPAVAAGVKRMSRSHFQIVSVALACMILGLVSYIFHIYKSSDRCYEVGKLFSSDRCLVTVDLLLNNPQKFDGKEVTIRGIFGLAFEGQSIRDASTKQDLWFQPTAETREKYRNTCGLVGEVKGKYIAGPSGHFGMYPGLFKEIKIIKVIEEKAYSCYPEEEFN